MLNYLQVVKAVVASLNNDGEPVFPRKWNHDFIDVPVVKNQHQPTLSKDQIEAIIGVPQACIGGKHNSCAAESLSTEAGHNED
jgi:hypothetical protein